MGAWARVPTLMTTIDCRVAREARPMGYLAGMVLLNQVHQSFFSRLARREPFQDLSTSSRTFFLKKILLDRPINVPTEGGGG